MTLALLERHSRVAIDSNVLIYLLEGSADLGDRTGALLDAIAAGEGQGVLATLALAEICSGPAGGNDLAMVERYADELSSLEGVRVVPLDREVAVEAALIRGSSNLSLADAIHLATARRAGATAFVTNDRRIVPMPRLDIVYLDDIGLP
jgi:predicted nucleic acid-binding protein